MDLTRVPIACELFKQWRKNRGAKLDAAHSRAFSRYWNDLLENAGLVSALDQSDAERDARELQKAGMLDIVPVRYKAHLIERVSIPLGVENKWMKQFGFTPPNDSDQAKIRNFAWQPELQFLREVRVNLGFEELQQLNQFFCSARDISPAPIKERSLTIFGDEKRLDILYGSSALFGEGKLTLEQLRCFIVPEPLGWRRGKKPEGPLIILENVATWHTYVQWDTSEAQFSAVIYGGGKRIVHSVSSLSDILAEIGGARPIFYFGDLDPMGLLIPRLASQRASAVGLPEIHPHALSYELLLKLAAEKPIAQKTEKAMWSTEDFLWLENASIAAAVEKLFRDDQRIAQEWLTLDKLFKSQCE